MLMMSRFWNEYVYVLRLCFLTGLGGFIHGYYSGVINNFLPPTRNEINKGSAWMYIHGLASSLVLWTTGSMLSHTKRRGGGGVELWDSPTCCCCSLFVVGGFLISTGVPYIERLLIGWFIIGCGSGNIIVSSTIYLAEISPTRIRGAIVASFFFQNATGQILYYLSALYSSDDNHHWHWIFGTIPLLFLFIFKSKNWFPHYSPNCLYALGKKEEAIQMLRKTKYSNDDVAREVKVLKLAVKNIDIGDLKPCFSENVKAGIACLLAQHLVGMNVIMYYTPKVVLHIFQLKPSSSKNLMLASLLIKSVLAAIGTLFCIAFVDRYGRRRLLLVSTFGIVTCLGFLSFALYGCTSNTTTVDSITAAASCIITGSDGVMGKLTVLGALGFYFIFHSMGIGTIPWIINAEIYPLRDRITYGMNTSGTYWFVEAWMHMSSLYVYLDIYISHYNMGIAVFILCLSSCVACCIVYIFAPETKGYPIEQVALLLQTEIPANVLKQREVIVTSREEIPYMFSSSSDSE